MASDNDSTGSIVNSLSASKDHRGLKPYLAKCRIISQTIHPFVDISRAFYAGIPEASHLEEEGGDRDEEEEYTDEERRVFKCIMKLERGFRGIVDACAEDPDAFLALINKVSEASAAGRSDDTTKLKKRIIHFLFEDERKGSAFPNELQQDLLHSDDPKSVRGWLHIETANLLCPLRLKEEFLDDPFTFMDSYQDGSLKITATDFPSFLYETGTKYNQDQEYVGLFKGFIMERVFRQIFTGPSSAFNPDERVNKSKAKKFGKSKPVVSSTNELTGHYKAYIALSSMSQWGEIDSRFKLDFFYNNIVAVLEQSKALPWYMETIEWFTERVPGLRSKAGRKKKGARSQDDVDASQLSPAERIAAQLRAATAAAPQHEVQENEWEEEQLEDPPHRDRERQPAEQEQAQQPIENAHEREQAPQHQVHRREAQVQQQQRQRKAPRESETDPEDQVEPERRHEEDPKADHQHKRREQGNTDTQHRQHDRQHNRQQESQWERQHNHRDQQNRDFQQGQQERQRDLQRDHREHQERQRESQYQRRDPQHVDSQHGQNGRQPDHQLDHHERRGPAPQHGQERQQESQHEHREHHEPHNAGPGRVQQQGPGRDSSHAPRDHLDGARSSRKRVLDGLFGASDSELTTSEDGEELESQPQKRRRSIRLQPTAQEKPAPSKAPALKHPKLKPSGKPKHH